MKLPVCLKVLTLSSLFIQTALTAVSVSTDPVGYVTVNIPGGSIGAPKVSLVSFPMLNYVPDTFIGKSTGTLDSVSQNQMTISSAGWSSGALSENGSPFFVHIISGNASGRIIQITGNTENKLTLKTDGVDLIPDVSIGDKIEIFPGDTILSIFGDTNDGIIGGNTAMANSNSGQVDEIFMLINSGWVKFFFNTDTNRWERIGLSFLGDQGNVVISPFSGVIFKRVGSSYNMVLSGRVPKGNPMPVVSTSGATFLATISPVDNTLGGLNIQSAQGWRSSGNPGVNPNNADLVFVLKDGWAKYYYDSISSLWLRQGLEFLGDQSNVIINSGSGILTSRFSPTVESELFVNTLPYN